MQVHSCSLSFLTGSSYFDGKCACVNTMKTEPTLSNSAIACISDRKKNYPLGLDACKTQFTVCYTNQSANYTYSIVLFL